MTCLKQEDKLFPQKLKELKNNPKKLYIEGNIDLLSSVGIAVIGTRHPSEYGKRMCRLFVKNLVQYGITIISGMAEGIDTIAHKTCLEYGGNTVAVLPCGLNNIYPKKNKKLYSDILNLGGTVVTEYTLQEKADSIKFLKRNRIVAGLGIGTLVIEAGYRSGTSVTARITMEQNKKVFCIPSNLDNKQGITANKIIQEGGFLVTCIGDIINEYKQYNFQKKLELSVNVESELLEVYNLLNDEPIYINKLAQKLGCKINDISYKLTMLELEGYIEKLPGDFFIRK